MMTLNLQHWRVETDRDGIATATLDKAGETANAFQRGHERTGAIA